MENSLVFFHVQSNQYIPMDHYYGDVLDSEDSDLEGRTDSERVGTQTAVNMKYVCLFVRGNVSVGISGIFWRKDLRLKMLTV